MDFEAPGKVAETVIVKNILNALDQDEKELFYNEVVLLNGLNHPNIVKMKGVYVCSSKRTFIEKVSFHCVFTIVKLVEIFGLGLSFEIWRGC